MFQAFNLCFRQGYDFSQVVSQIVELGCEFHTFEGNQSLLKCPANREAAVIGKQDCIMGFDLFADRFCQVLGSGMA